MYNPATRKGLCARLTRSMNTAVSITRSLRSVFDDLPLAGINNETADEELQAIMSQLLTVADSIKVFRDVTVKED